jgi:hypothetical protein
METSQSLRSAQNKVIEAFDAGEPIDCPCCGQLVKKYPYNMGGIYIKQLTYLVEVGDWVKGTDMIFNTVGGWRKYSFLRWWNVAIEDEGYFKSTLLGVKFLQGKSKIPKTIFLFNNKLIGTSREQIFVDQCCDEHFDFSELMNPDRAKKCLMDTPPNFWD